MKWEKVFVVVALFCILFVANAIAAILMLDFDWVKVVSILFWVLLSSYYVK